jgi:hypothetical protein
MHVEAKQCVRVLTACVLVTIFFVPKDLLGQTAQHVVSPSEMQKAVMDASQVRQKNLDTLRAFFSSERAQHALKAAHTDPEQVKKAVASLSDAELAQLASRAQTAQADFAAGHLSDRDLIIILIAIAALILIIVAVH